MLVTRISVTDSSPGGQKRDSPPRQCPAFESLSDIKPTMATPSPPRSPQRSPPPALPSSLAFLSLSQDITALISLSLEATASLVHDWFRTTLSTAGLGDLVPSRRDEPVERAKLQGGGGRGMAVVVVGANEGELLSSTLDLQVLDQ